MLLKFYKYHGAGNDFIILDNRDLGITLDSGKIAWLCDRHFGIGADGFMTLEQSGKYDFRMRYYNSDGKEGTMCGNGGRCIVHFAKKTGAIKSNSTVFSAIDGIHHAEIISDNTIKLQMNPVEKSKISHDSNGITMDTGSPHLIIFNNDIDSVDVFYKGRKIRYSPAYAPNNGINVNFVEMHSDYIRIRTYERGVEAETLACGTGSVAAALTTHLTDSAYSSPITVKARGGTLTVYFDENNDFFENIWLEGPAEFVFVTQINM